MNDKNFAALFCANHGLAPEAYERAMFQRCLYPHARFLAPLVRLLWPAHFTADLDFVRSVGRLRRFREFSYEAEEFAHHPANRGFWRQTANVRISSRALRRVVRATLHPESEGSGDANGETAEPFEGRGAATHETKRLGGSSGASA
jgi:hypothetical protein